MAGTKETADAIRKRLPMDERLESPKILNGLLRHMGQWRQTMIGGRHVHYHGFKIYAGPFKGMDYLDYSTEGCLLPRLLGCYEQELHDDLRAFVDEGIEAIIDIGCAEGYYAVGLARLMPDAKVFAYDTNPKARKACAGLAEKNGVADRIEIGETFTGDLFERYANRKTLVMIDTEGFEEELMKPDLWPALAGMSIIMETHPEVHPRIVDTMMERFGPTHDILVRTTANRAVILPPELSGMNHLDQLLAIWEFRATPTPWLVMRPKAESAAR